jgi:hypothetical protein
MLLLEGFISNFTYARYYFLILYVEFSAFYVNQSLAGQTLPVYEEAFKARAKIWGLKRCNFDLIYFKY